MAVDQRALSLLSSMVLEDGSRWGDRAAPFQWNAAEALLDPSVPPFRWESRARGLSKTTDAAGVLLSAMLTMLRPGSRCDAYAGGRDQARLLVDSIDGLVQRTPGLRSAVAVTDYKVSTNAGVILEVMSADAATAHGRKPSWVVVDEICQWPTGSNAKKLWQVIYSSLPKVQGARMVVITTSGDPQHFSRRVYEAAVKSPLWSVAEVPGSESWIDPVQLEEQRRMLPASVFARLMLNEWTSAEDRLVNEDDLRACVTLSGPQEPEPGVQYVIGVDLGVKRDRTVVAVCHAEPLDDGRQGRVTVLDRMQVWQGSRLHPVPLGQVEEWIFLASQRYGGASVVCDPWQAMGMIERLKGQRVKIEEFVFSAQSVGRLASNLMLALRDHRLALPDDPELLDELGSVRLRETSPGTLRMDHDADGHDDRAIALALAANWLSERSSRRPMRMIYYGPPTY